MAKTAFPKEDDDYFIVKYFKKCMIAFRDLFRTFATAILSPKGLALMFSILGFICGALFVVYYKDLKKWWKKSDKKLESASAVASSPTSYFDAKNALIPQNSEKTEELPAQEVEEERLEAKGKNRGNVQLKNPNRNLKTNPSMMHRVRTYAGVITPPDMRDMNPEDFDRTVRYIVDMDVDLDDKLDDDKTTDILGSLKFAAKNVHYLPDSAKFNIDRMFGEYGRAYSKVRDSGSMNDSAVMGRLRAIAEALEAYDDAFRVDHDSLEMNKAERDKARQIIRDLLKGDSPANPIIREMVKNDPVLGSDHSVPLCVETPMLKPITFGDLLEFPTAVNNPRLLEARMPVVPRVSHCWLCKKTDHKYTHCSQNSSKKWHFVPLSLVKNTVSPGDSVHVIGDYGYLYDNTRHYYNWVTKTLNSVKEEGAVAGKSMVSFDDCHNGVVPLLNSSGVNIGTGFVAHNYLTTARHVLPTEGLHVKKDENVLLKLEDSMPPEPLRTLLVQKDFWCFRNPALRSMWKCGVNYSLGDYITIPAYMDGNLYVSQGKILSIISVNNRVILTYDVATAHGFSGAPIIHDLTGTIIGHHVAEGDVRDVNVGEGFVEAQVSFLKAPMTKKNLN